MGKNLLVERDDSEFAKKYAFHYGLFKKVYTCKVHYKLNFK